MTFHDDTAPSQTAAISLTFALPHAPEKVWRALTDPELLARWLLPVSNFSLDPHSAFSFQAPPQPGWDGAVDCQLLEVEPHRRIAYTWNVGDMHTVVTFTLSPTPSGTCLSLVHSGFQPEQKKNFSGARYGWKLMGAKLVDVLGDIPLTHDA